ncbi:MAG: type I 3-dehydroquinate dehydratase [Bacteroidia bacterium]|nr:MAG: type I 3-dehydroquinate dehydratase [Bacteroidia bacterium]
MICVSVSHRNQLEKAVQSGAALLELRLDLIGEKPEKLFPAIPKSIPTVLTCRPGIYNDEERAALLKQGLELGAAYVDVETESPDAFLSDIKQCADLNRAKLIVSYHNFERTPGLEDLESVMIGCFERGGDIAKIATRVNGTGDILNLIALYGLPGQKVILGMGPLGRILRILSPYLGGAFTFASLGEGKETAPGQLSIKEMNEIYKVIDKS